MPKVLPIVIAGLATLGLGACGADSPSAPTAESGGPNFMGGGTQTDPPQNAFISTAGAWPYSRGSGVKVLVIDQAYPTSHVDLPTLNAAHTLTCPGAASSVSPSHGAAVAGVIAAVDDTDGIVGIAPDVELYFAQIRSATHPYASGVDAACAIRAAFGLGIEVVNMSINVDPNSAGADSLAAAIADGVSSYGMVFVAAAGNTSGGAVYYPASDPNVIAVAGAGSNGQLFSGATAAPANGLAAAWLAYTTSTSPAAPGCGYPNTADYFTCGGSSFASPAVAAAAAIVIGANGALTNAQVAQILRASPTSTATGLGYGIVNATRAAQFSQPIAGPPTNVAVATGVTSLAVNWQNGDASAGISTRVRWRQPGGSWSEHTKAAGVTTDNISSLLSGTVYEVTVNHVRGPIFATSVVTVLDTTYATLPPTSAQANGVTTNSAIITWVNGNTVSGTSTKVERRVSGGSTWTTVAPGLSAGIADLELTGLSAATSYEVRVTHYRNGFPSASSVTPTFTTGYTGIPALASPVGFSMTGCSESQQAGKTYVGYNLGWSSGANSPLAWWEIKQSSTNNVNTANVTWRGAGNVTSSTAGPFLVASGTAVRYLWIRHIGNGSASSWQPLDTFPLEPAEGCGDP